jgi:hypothetical protein
LNYQAVQHSGNRAGLLVSGDLRAACRTILAEELDLEGEGEAKSEWTAETFDDYLDRSAQLRELCAFAVSEEYFQARQALGVTAQPVEAEIVRFEQRHEELICLVVVTVDEAAVHAQERVGDEECDPLVSIHERMIHREALH